LQQNVKSIPLHHALRSKKKLQELFSFKHWAFSLPGSILPLVETSLLTDGCTLLNDHNPKELSTSQVGHSLIKEKKKKACVCILHQLGAHANTKHNC
jgi:hypothetical protein